MILCPECGYYNEEKYDEYSPYPLECENCYRYDICRKCADDEKGGNRMKYIIELEKIEGTDLYRAIGANTLVFDEKGIKNMLKPLPEPETDWSKVPVDTPIYVGDTMEEVEKKKWPRYFAKYENGKIYAWADGMTSFTTQGSMIDWSYVKLAEE